MTPRFDAAIVDLDGTMVDTLGDFEVALNLMLDDLKLPHVNRSFIEHTVGKGSEHLIRSTLNHVAHEQNRLSAHTESALLAIKNVANSLSFDDAWQRYQYHYLRINGQASEVFAGVREGLEALKAAGLRLACLTNKPTAFARPLLKVKGLEDYFSHVFGGDAFERKKPDPLPLLKTCEALGTSPMRTLMIGDSSNDAQAAHAAQCPVILVTYGYNHGQDIRAVDALAHVDSMREVSRWL